MSFHHPGVARHFGASDAAAPNAPRFDFWRSMAELVALVMRSGAAGLAWRVPAALGCLPARMRW